MPFKSSKQEHFFFAQQKDKKQGMPTTPGMHPPSAGMAPHNPAIHPLGMPTQQPQLSPTGIIPQIPSTPQIGGIGLGTQSSRFPKVKNMFKGQM